ncbi:MAG TPA: tetratricopeptide repeat protein, partial [Pirellulales bacterium]|nr:tetratricopeptide repeat protein [Pirellulales bacterium]
HLNLGIALWHLGREGPALQEIEEALRLAPKNPEAKYNYASLLRTEGRKKEAVDQLRQVIALDPLYWRAHLLLSLLLKEQGLVDEAARHYLQAQQINPGVSALSGSSQP